MVFPNSQLILSKIPVAIAVPLRFASFPNEVSAAEFRACNKTLLRLVNEFRKPTATDRFRFADDSVHNPSADSSTEGRYSGSICKEASLPGLAVRYYPSAWSPALAAGPYLRRTRVSVPHAGVPFPFSTRRPWTVVEPLSCPRHLHQNRTRHKAEDSRRALFSSSGIGSSLRWGAAAWVKSTVLKTSSLGML